MTWTSLRRTFCSLLDALGDDPGTVMDEMGHTNPALALRVYRQAVRRGEDEKAQLRALVEGADVAESGRRASEVAPRYQNAEPPEPLDSAALSHWIQRPVDRGLTIDVPPAFCPNT
jgi:hypothetical protein